MKFFLDEIKQKLEQYVNKQDSSSSIDTTSAIIPLSKHIYHI
jgi:hypothetical protein